MLIIPSWFPTKDRPLSGIFFAEQSHLFAKLHPQFDVHVCVFEEPRESVSPRHPGALLGALHAATNRAPNSSTALERNYTVHRFTSFNWREGWKAGGIDFDVTRAERLARQIAADGSPFSLVHAHVSHPGGMVGRKLAEKLRVPFVLSEHMSPFPFPDLLDIDGAILPKVRWPILGAEVVTAVSMAHAKEIELACGVKPRVVPNYVSSSRFSLLAAGPKAKRFVSVGHLVEQKGFDNLLRAFREAREIDAGISLQIVGEGKERSSLESLSSRLGLSDCVQFRGAASREELPKIYQNSDYFVLASRHESFGVVVIEALASGLPCIVTRCGGPEEIIVNKDLGVVVGANDSAALARAVLDVLSTRWNANTIREYFMAHFSGEAVTGRWAEIYQTLVAKQTGSPVATAR